MLEIVIPLFPGVTQLDFTGPHQVLSRAPDARIVTASMGGQDIGSEGLVFTKLADLTKVERCDVLLVPGGGGATAAGVDEAFVAEIQRLGRQAKYVTSVCTGALVLGAAGFLQGKRAATHWAWRDLLPLFGATVSEERVCRDGNLFTGGGVTAGVDFALTLLAEVSGQAVAETVQLTLEYAPEPPFNAGRSELAPPAVLEAYKASIAKSAVQRRAQAEAAAARLQQPA